MIGGMGHFEWLVILVIVLIIFGAGKLPQVGGNLGKAIRNFRSGVKDKEEEIEAAKEQEKIEPTTADAQPTNAQKEKTKV